jgi:hypothetical protein
VGSAPKFHHFYDNAVPSDLCRRVIDAFEKDVDGQFKGNLMGEIYRPDMKECTDIRISDRIATADGRPIWEGIDAELYKCVAKSWTRFLGDVESLQRVGPEFGLVDTGYQLQRYEQGVGKFTRHIDAGSMSTICRVAAAVIYLNTVEVGGGTRFIDWGETVDAVEGRILWFPAGWTHAHEGLVSESGRKYIASTFMCFKGHWLLAAGSPCFNHIAEAVKE